MKLYNSRLTNLLFVFVSIVVVVLLLLIMFHNNNNNSHHMYSHKFRWLLSRTIVKDGGGDSRRYSCNALLSHQSQSRQPGFVFVSSWLLQQSSSHNSYHRQQQQHTSLMYFKNRNTFTTPTTRKRTFLLTTTERKQTTWDDRHCQCCCPNHHLKTTFVLPHYRKRRIQYPFVFVSSQLMSFSSNKEEDPSTTISSEIQPQQQKQKQNQKQHSSYPLPNLVDDSDENDFNETTTPTTSTIFDTKLNQAENTFRVLAKQNRTWQRLRPIVELALMNCCNDVNVNVPTNITTTAYDQQQQEHEQINSRIYKKRIAIDVGTDHGLLAFGLAKTNTFHKVIGIDASISALQDGAYKLLDTVRTYRRRRDVVVPVQQKSVRKKNPTESYYYNDDENNSRTTTIHSNDNNMYNNNKNSNSLSSVNRVFLNLDETNCRIEFYHGDGLRTLIQQKLDDDDDDDEPNEANYNNISTTSTVCIAGMGIRTMIDILTASIVPTNNTATTTTKTKSTTTTSIQDTNNSESVLLLLNYINCEQIIVQPAKAKPYELMKLYDTLYQMGWSIQNENIIFDTIGCRYYVSSSFVRQQQKTTKKNHNNSDTNNDTSIAYKEDPTSIHLKLPGSILLEKYHHNTNHNGSSKEYWNEKQLEESIVFQRWVNHHIEWITSDMKKMKIQSLSDNEKRWMEQFATTTCNTTE